MKLSTAISILGLSTAMLLITPTHFLSPLLAQQVRNVNPSLNSDDVSPDASISGVFQPKNGVGVNVNSVRIYVNNKDVTNRSTITANFFSYRPDMPLPSGSNQVRLEYKNDRGQDNTVIWTFNVREAQTKLEINSVTHNGEGKPLGPGATFLVTVKGTPSARAEVLLVENGRTVRQLPVQEISSGVYIATLSVQPNDNIREGVVIARLQRQNQTIFRSATRPFVLSQQATSEEVPSTKPGNPTNPNNNQTSTRPLTPVFTSHKNGDLINTRGFTLTGQTRPNAQVKIKVIANLSILGGLVNLSNNTLVDQVISADNQGNFQVQVPPPPTIASGLEYTVQAVANNNNETSQPVQLILIQR